MAKRVYRSDGGFYLLRLFGNLFLTFTCEMEHNKVIDFYQVERGFLFILGTIAFGAGYRPKMCKLS